MRTWVLVQIGTGLVLAVLWWVVPTMEPPRYHVHTCLREHEAEPWDSTLRIEMVGRAHYLLRVTPQPLFRPQTGHAMTFHDVHDTMTVVDCPTKE